MNVFDYAMKMEQDGEAYYREGAKEAEGNGNKGLATILNFLADEEVKHYNIFKAMKEGKRDSLPPSNLMRDVKNIFEEMKESGDTFNFDAKQVDYYEKAKVVEKESEDFYREKAAETTAVHEKDNLLKIADEEARHYRLLDSIKEFVQRPERWLEDAEWNHLEDY